MYVYGSSLWVEKRKFILLFWLICCTLSVCLEFPHFYSIRVLSHLWKLSFFFFSWWKGLELYKMKVWHETSSQADKNLWISNKKVGKINHLLSKVFLTLLPVIICLGSNTSRIRKVIPSSNFISCCLLFFFLLSRVKWSIGPPPT